MHTYRIKASIQKLICHQSGAGGKQRANPFVWCIFFKVDGEGIIITDNFKLAGQAGVHFSAGSHQNLGNVRAETGTIINIPPAVGEWNNQLIPLKMPYFETDFPGILGITCIAMTQGLVSDKAIEAGHQKLNEFVVHSIEKSVAGFDPRHIDVYNLEASVKSYFRQSVAEISVGLDRVIAQAVVSNQGILQNLRTLLKRDALIGFKVWDFNHTDIARNHGNLTFTERWTHPDTGDWEVQGSLKALVMDTQAG